MFNTKRKRAVALALIAFFCGAIVIGAVDWKRFGGGFLAFLKPRGESNVAHAGGGSPSGSGVQLALTDSHAQSGAPPRLTPGASHRHRSGAANGSGHPSADDLFKYGDPAAGGIPAGSFLVAQNDAPGGVAGAAPSIDTPSAPDAAVASTGDGGDGGVTSPAPAPAGTGGGFDDGGLVITSPAPAPSTGTPVSTPPSPTPAPNQSGTTDQDPGDGGTPIPPVITTPPVSAVPEASNAAMMGLGALFLAVAATRKRRNGQG
jgi:hypothetical protein